MQTDTTNIDRIVNLQKAFFAGGPTRDISFRRRQLKLLQSAVAAHEADIFAALRDDLSKSAFEAYAGETGLVQKEIRHALKKLGSWTKVQKAPTVLAVFPASGHIQPEPYGVCLIISPWNYPFQLSVSPLVASMAAGNCSVLKPSRFAPHTAAVLAKIVSETFDPGYICVIKGDEAGKDIAEKPFDLIFFCGSKPVGKTVMTQAAKNLTPVILELGGKNPCIVHEDANLEVAARRIVWGKLLNAGQTCVAPDYLLAQKNIKGRLIDKLTQAITDFFGADPSQSPDFARIVNDHHFKRLSGLLDCGRIAIGGQTDASRRYIAPTVIDDVDWADVIMGEEVFGPILPVLQYSDVSQVVEQLSSQPKPLALYLFSSDRRVQQRIFRELSFGGGCINDTVVHYVNPNLPFGGVGASGMGCYHGRFGFESFSHRKSILKNTSKIDLRLRYPPYKGKLGLLRRLF